MEDAGEEKSSTSSNNIQQKYDDDDAVTVSMAVDQALPPVSTSEIHQPAGSTSDEMESVQEGHKRRRLTQDLARTTQETPSPSSPAAALPQHFSVTTGLHLPSSTQPPPPPPPQLSLQRGGRRGRTWSDDFGPGPSMASWGPEPLALGYSYTPYETVKAVVSHVRAFLRNFHSIKSGMVISWVPPAASLPATPSVELVLEELDDFVDTVQRETIGLWFRPFEMERRLMEFQVGVGAASSPSWFRLMNLSTMSFWEYLYETFLCETIDLDPVLYAKQSF